MAAVFEPAFDHEDVDGYYICLGRTGDMLKASGVWVSPAEVEDRLLAHEAVAQAAAEAELIELVPRWPVGVQRFRRVVFADAYPTTATGRIRRVELRQIAATVLRPAAR